MTMRLAVRTARVTLALVWLHQGVWSKVLGRDASHREIVGRMPGMDAATARALTVAIGCLEAGVATWVLSGRSPRACAAVQTGLIAGFNTGALLFARDRIDSPGGLLARNAGLVALAWIAAW